MRPPLRHPGIRDRDLHRQLQGGMLPRRGPRDARAVRGGKQGERRMNLTSGIFGEVIDAAIVAFLILLAVVSGLVILHACYRSAVSRTRRGSFFWRPARRAQRAD